MTLLKIIICFYKNGMLYKNSFMFSDLFDLPLAMVLSSIQGKQICNIGWNEIHIHSMHGLQRQQSCKLIEHELNLSDQSGQRSQKHKHTCTFQ